MSDHLRVLLTFILILAYLSLELSGRQAGEVIPGKVLRRIRVSLFGKKKNHPDFRVVLSRYDSAMNYLCLVGRAGLEPATT